MTVQECLEYMGDLAGVPKAECKKRIEYYLKRPVLQNTGKENETVVRRYETTGRIGAGAFK